MGILSKFSTFFKKRNLIKKNRTNRATLELNSFLNKSKPVGGRSAAHRREEIKLAHEDNQLLYKGGIIKNPKEFYNEDLREVKELRRNKAKELLKLRKKN